MPSPCRSPSSPEAASAPKVGTVGVSAGSPTTSFAPANANASAWSGTIAAISCAGVNPAGVYMIAVAAAIMPGSGGDGRAGQRTKLPSRPMAVNST